MDNSPPMEDNFVIETTEGSLFEEFEQNNNNGTDIDECEYDDDDDVCAELLKESLEDSLTTKNDSLSLEDYDIGKVPEILATYDHVKILYIMNTDLALVDCLPPNVQNICLKNNKILSVDPECVPDTVKCIILENNFITDVNFIKPNVKLVNLKNNSVESITCDLSSLDSLNLGNNDIKDLESLLPDMPYIQALCLEDNRNLKNIDCLGCKTPRLRRLNTSRCNIAKVSVLPENLVIWKSEDSGIFMLNMDSFPKYMTCMYLRDNNISHIKTEMVSSIKEMHLSGNNIFELFKCNSGLELLDLSGNSNLKMDGDTEKKITKLRMNNCKVILDIDKETSDGNWRRDVDMDDNENEYIRRIRERNNHIELMKRHHAQMEREKDIERVQRKRYMMRGLGPEIKLKKHFVI